MAPVLSPGDKVVLTTVGTHGDLLPFLRLGCELQARGMRVDVATVDLYEAEVRAQGLGFVRLSPGEQEVRERLGLDLAGLMARATHKLTGPRFAIRELLLPNLERNLQELEAACAGATLLVSHLYSFAAPLVVERTGIAWRSVVLQPMALASPWDPSVLSALLPLHRLQPLLGPRRFAKLVELGKAATRHWFAPVDALRRRLGLAPAAGHPLFEGGLSPQGALALFDPVLLQGTRDLPPQLALLGFCWADEAGQALAPALEAFLARHAAPVVFTLGTSAVHNPGRFWERARRAARALGVPAVFLTGDYRFATPLDEDQIAVPWAWHATLFPRARVVVHQGGMGTCFQALRAGVPQLVVPHGNDQPDNAARLVRLGVALGVDSALAFGWRIRSRLRRLLEDPHFAASAARVRSRLLPEDGARAAARLLTGR